MARTFDGTDDEIRMTVSTALNITAPSTFMLIARRAANGQQNPLRLVDSGSTNRNGPFLNASDQIGCAYGSAPVSTITVQTSDGLVMFGCDKSSGNTTPRVHRFVYSTATWTHGNASTTATNGTAPSTSGLLYIGNRVGGPPWNGDIELVAIWNRQLTDAEWELLPYSLASILASNPVALYVLDQTDVAIALNDWTGNGSTQSVITGTSVATTHPYEITRDGQVWQVIRPQVATGGLMSAAVATATAQAETATLTGGASITADVAATTAAALAAAPVAGGRLDALTATVTAQGETASLTAGAVFDGIAATATAAGETATLTGGASLSGVAAIVTAEAPAASLTGAGISTLNAQTATATAEAYAATVTTGAAVLAQTATATATAPVAALGGSITVSAATATTTAEGHAALFTGGGALLAEVATAMGTALELDVITGAVVMMETATATAAALAALMGQDIIPSEIIDAPITAPVQPSRYGAGVVSSGRYRAGVV